MTLHPSRLLFRQSPKLLGVIVFLLVSLSFAATFSYLYAQAYQQQEDNLREQVRALAATVAALVNVDAHEKLRDPSQLSSAEYEQVLKPLVGLHQQHPELHYVYTMRVDDAKREYFVLDTANDPSIQKMMTSLGREIEASAIGEEYDVPDNLENDLAGKAMNRGETYVYQEVLEDGFGNFISGQAPLFDAGGRYVGYAGVDFNKAAFYASMLELRKTGAIGMVMVSLLSLGLAVLAYQMRSEADFQLEEANKAELQTRAEKERAEMAVSEKADLLAVASHDLKNPLSAISSLADMSLSELNRERDPKLYEMTQLISEATNQMLKIVSDVLFHEGLDHRGIELNPTPVDFGKLAGEVVEFNRPSAGRKGIELVSQIEDGLCAELDLTRMREAMDNLVSNAVKYSPRDSVVEVSVDLDAKQQEIRFEVQDQGPGLAAADQAKLFQKFSNLGSKPTGGELSTGLGLSIAKSIVEMHGGRIGCDTELGEGCRVWIAIPAVSCALGEPS